MVLEGSWFPSSTGLLSGLVGLDKVFRGFRQTLNPKPRFHRNFGSYKGFLRFSRFLAGCSGCGVLYGLYLGAWLGSIGIPSGSLVCIYREVAT